MEGAFLQFGSDLDPFGHISGVHYDSVNCRIAQKVGCDDLHVAPAAAGMGNPGLKGR